MHFQPFFVTHISYFSSFRRQHEQLQAVIVRVLRPTAVSQPQQGGALPSSDQGDTALETDDLSAVREVKLAYENVKVVDCLDLTPEGNAGWEAALKRCACVCEGGWYTCVFVEGWSIIVDVCSPDTHVHQWSPCHSGTMNVLIV